MKSGLLVCLTALLMIICAACSDDGEAKIIPHSKPADATTGRVVEITANDAMRFDVTSFEANPGERITVNFVNAGRMPKAVMGHNWVLLKAGTDARVFVQAGATHGGTEFIDPNTRDDVLAATAMLGPDEIARVTFTVPEEAGEYTYVCTFPGHLAAGMKGIMTVAP